MEGEINNFIMIRTSVYASVCYCYGIAKSVPEGVARLFAYLPVVILFIILPFNLYSIHLGGTTALFITWLAKFKILLFAFGMGPLSDPSLPLSHFFVLACFPIEVQANPSPKYPQGVDEPPKFVPNGKNCHTKLNVMRKTSSTGLKPPLYYEKKALLLPFLVSLTLYKNRLHTKAFMVMHCVYIFLGLECMFAGVATLVHVLFGLEFKDRLMTRTSRTPYKTFGAEGGTRWSRVSCVQPYTIPSSAISQGPWGLCYVVEDGLRRKFTVAWRLPRLMTGVIIFGFEIILFSWLVIPELLGFNADVRSLEEYMAVVKFMMSLGQAWKGKGYYLLVNVEASWTKLNKVMRRML
ncbi:hypothetical protein RJ639_031435 [Escallonia herrerae]|uniref:Wax synthase domain-containing protein n=1 Tax=Escallonia herrerae TaxID=1293975 RepID=A0AA89BCL8_9ASTE|nr:hypothetical protein RJ639_031435 [Escallonia herrerae]